MRCVHPSEMQPWMTAQHETPGFPDLGTEHQTCDNVHIPALCGRCLSTLGENTMACTSKWRMLPNLCGVCIWGRFFPAQFSFYSFPSRSALGHHLVIHSFFSSSPTLVDTIPTGGGKRRDIQRQLK